MPTKDNLAMPESPASNRIAFALSLLETGPHICPAEEPVQQPRSQRATRPLIWKRAACVQSGARGEFVLLAPIIFENDLTSLLIMSNLSPLDQGFQVCGYNMHTELQRLPVAKLRRVFFLHLLKTGGMTFRGILASIYGDSFHVCVNPSIESITASLAEFGCIEFHALPWQGDFVLMHGELAARRRWDLLEGADVFAIFREPVDQIVSLYFHILRKRAFVSRAFTANGIPFPESLEEFIEFPWHFNNQVAFLTGNYRFATKSELGLEDLVHAKEILTTLHVHAGLTERFADSVHIFETVTGQRIPGGLIENRNLNLSRPSLDEIPCYIKKRIEASSALDIELYKFARELFTRDLARCGPSPTYTFW